MYRSHYLYFITDRKKIASYENDNSQFSRESFSYFYKRQEREGREMEAKGMPPDEQIAVCSLPM